MLPVELNQLPRHSEWVAELLQHEPSVRIKNDEQIQREFGRDKWGSLLKKWDDSPCSIDDVYQWECPPESEHCGLIGEALMLMTSAEARNRHADLVEDALLKDGSQHLVEIGCGYGAVLFELIKRNQIQYDTVIGLEYTPQGVELAQKLAAWHGYRVQVGKGDYGVSGITDLPIPPGSDIFSSFSLHYVSDAVRALSNLINLKPRRVLHFEPVYHHCDEHTVLGILQRRYMSVNGYNLGIRDALSMLSESGLIEIIEESPTIFGANCLLPASLIVWRPA